MSSIFTAIEPQPLDGTVAGIVQLSADIGAFSPSARVVFVDTFGDQDRLLGGPVEPGEIVTWETARDWNRRVRLVARVVTPEGAILAKTYPKPLRIMNHNGWAEFVDFDHTRVLRGVVPLKFKGRRGDGRVEYGSHLDTPSTYKDHAVRVEIRVSGVILVHGPDRKEASGYVATKIRDGLCGVADIPLDTRLFPNGKHFLSGVVETVNPEDEWCGRCKAIDPRVIRISNLGGV